MSKDIIKEYKEKFGYKNISNKNLISAVLDNKEYINNLKKSLTKEEVIQLDELMPIFEEFLDFLEKQDIYKIVVSLDLQDIVQDKTGSIKKIVVDLPVFLLKLKNLIDFMNEIKDNKHIDKKLKNYILANIYGDMFEGIRHVLVDLMEGITEYFQNKSNELALNELRRLGVKKERAGITHFLFLLELIDKKFNREYKHKFSGYFDIELRNAIAHLSVYYGETSLSHDAGRFSYENKQLIDKTMKIYLFMISFLYNNKGPTSRLFMELQNNKEAMRQVLAHADEIVSYPKNILC